MFVLSFQSQNSQSESPKTLHNPPSTAHVNTGRFIMFSIITNIYNKKTKGPTLMELFADTGNLKKFVFFFTLTRVWQQLEYRIDVCRVTRGAQIEHV
jgi:hypothetical protein